MHALQAAVWASLNGVGLALVVPAAMAIVADYHLPEQRGRAFGFLFTVAALGVCAVLYVCLPASQHTYLRALSANWACERAPSLGHCR